MTSEFLIVEKTGGVTKITLNRPEVLNSFNLPMARELRHAIDELCRDDSARSLLLTGAGRAFCAGQDLSAATPDVDGHPDLGETVRTAYNPIIRAIRALEKPVVCAVNGVAAGAGANLAIACDIVIASDTASFIQSFSKIGLVPDTGGTFFLPRTVGFPMATAMMMLGEKITAQRAHEMGMIYRICPADALAEESMQLAVELAEMPTRGIGLTKRALNSSLSNDLDGQLETEEELQRLAGQTDDFVEGIAAFREKRKPVFRGQ